METVPLYCICRKPYDETQFMIECDKCQDWFHGSCVNVQEHQAADIEYYHCPGCAEKYGPLVLKKTMNWHRHDYSENGDGKAVQTGTLVFIKGLKNRVFPSAEEIIIRLKGYEVNPDYFRTHGFNLPILVENKDGLNMKLPPSDITIEEIERRVGSMREIDVIDVARQEDHKMLMRSWTDYYNNSKRTKILNVISLEFSKTNLSELVEPPQVVKQVSWVSTLWPEEMPDEMLPERPDVQKYCLMGVKDSFTDFHIDFGGTSVWYHVLRGQKIFYLVEPTEDNLNKFENWLSSSAQSENFFGDQADCCRRTVVKQGQTLFIPTGWIHAVLTPVDSLVFGGNFLHSYNIPLQLEAYEIERRVKTPEKYQFPSYETVNWYAAKHILDILKACSEDGQRPDQYIIDGAAALAKHLKKWTQRKDYTKKCDDPAELEGIQYGKLIRSINSELKHWEVTKSPTKGHRKKEKSPEKEKKSKKKKKKKEIQPISNISTSLKEFKTVTASLKQSHCSDNQLLADEIQQKNIYNFEEAEEEKIAPPLKMHIPKAGAKKEKKSKPPIIAQEPKVPPVKIGALTKPADKVPSVKIGALTKPADKVPSVKLGALTKPADKVPSVKIGALTKPADKVPSVNIGALTKPADKVPSVKIGALTKPAEKVPPVKIGALTKPADKVPPVRIGALTKPPEKVPPVKIGALTKPAEDVPPVKIGALTKPAEDVLPVKIGALTKPADEVPPVKIGALSKPADKEKKSRHKKGSRGKHKKKDNSGSKDQPEVKEEVKEKEEKDSFKLKVSNGNIIPSSGGDSTVDKKPDFQPLVPAVKQEEDNDSDQEMLVVDENPKAQQKNSKVTTAAKTGLKMKLSIGGKGPSEEEASELAKEGSFAWRMKMPIIRGGLNGSISDILAASGYGTEHAFKVDDYASSQSQIMAIEGMLSMSQGSREGSSLFAPASQGLFSPSRSKPAVKDEEEKLMADCIQEGDYMYPSFDLSDDEQLIGTTGKVEEKDDNWNPKARVDVTVKMEERSQRLGAKNQAIASGLAATAKKLAETPPVAKKKAGKSPSGKHKEVEPEYEVSPLPGPSDNFVGSGSAFRPGVKRVLDRTPSAPVNSKAKKPKKGEATAKQRLSKKLKINSARFCR